MKLYNISNSDPGIPNIAIFLRSDKVLCVQYEIQYEKCKLGHKGGVQSKSKLHVSYSGEELEGVQACKMPVKWP